MGGILQVLQALSGGGGGGRKGGGKGKGKNRANMSIVSANAKKNPEVVAWIGGLKEKESGTSDEYKEINTKLKAHIVKLAGEGCKFVNITKKGQGGAVFGSEEEAQTAIATVNGTKFMGKNWKLMCGLRRNKIVEAAAVDIC